MKYEDVEKDMKVKVSHSFKGKNREWVGKEGTVYRICSIRTPFPISVYFGEGITRTFDPEELEKV